MRRLALVFLLLWLPLHWGWAASLVMKGHPSAPLHAAQAAVLESLADGQPHGVADPVGEQEEDCPVCQAADWQAALPASPAFGPVEAPALPLDTAAPFKSHVPPVPKPPARLAAA
jgi:hypothetical protein